MGMIAELLEPLPEPAPQVRAWKVEIVCEDFEAALKLADREAIARETSVVVRSADGRVTYRVEVKKTLP